MVQDHGRGITEENLPFVFNPFFSTKATGTGMGMAIAQRLVQEHLGRMELDSQVGRGTTVSLLLPVSPHQ
jgi:two-component system sensor histidine kinase HydH